MTKERRGGLRHDVVYVIVCFGSCELHYLTIEEELYFWSLSRTHSLSVLFK